MEGDIMKKNKRVLIVIIIAILIIVLSILSVIFEKKKTNGDGKKDNNYQISDKVEEEPGTKSYTTDKIKKSHCVDDICVKDVVFYYNDNQGRIEYKVINNSSKTASGYMKIVYSNKDFNVIYDNLAPGQFIETRTQFSGVKISDQEDYKLEKLSKEEINKIIKK